MQNQVKRGISLSKAIEDIIRESMKTSLHQNAVEEKEKQNNMLGEEDADLFADDKKDLGAKEKPKLSKTVNADKEKLRKGEIKADDIVNKLNTIRSGKSFKDSDIALKLDEYIESLTTAEKVALLAYLKGIAQIVTGEIDPSNATEPSDSDPDIKMKKGSTAQKKTIVPNVIKAPEKEKTEKKPSSEDTSGPVPISPKKK